MNAARLTRKVDYSIAQAAAHARAADDLLKPGRVANFERLHDEWRSLNGLTKLVRDGKGNVWEPVRVTVPVTLKTKPEGLAVTREDVLRTENAVAVQAGFPQEDSL